MNFRVVCLGRREEDEGVFVAEVDGAVGSEEVEGAVGAYYTQESMSMSLYTDNK